MIDASLRQPFPRSFTQWPGFDGTRMHRRYCRCLGRHNKAKNLPIPPIKAPHRDVPVSRRPGMAGSDRRTGDRRKSPSLGGTCQCLGGQICVYLDTQSGCRGATPIDRRSLPGATAVQATAGSPRPQGRCTNVVERTRPREVPVRRGDARERRGQICVYLDTQSHCRGATPTDRYSTKGGLR